MVQARIPLGLLLLYCSYFPHVTASSGGVTGGGGGDVISCEHPLRTLLFAKPRTVFLADTFSWFSSPTAFQGIKKHEFHYKLPQAFFKRVVLNAQSSFEKDKDVSKRYDELKIIPSKKLKNFADDNIKSVPKGCVLEQVAIQVIGENDVFISANPYLLLHPLEHVLLKLHEAKISTRGVPGDTTPIRESILALLASVEFTTTFNDSLNSVNYEKLNTEMLPLLLEYVHFACVSSHICSPNQTFSSFMKFPLPSKPADYPNDSSEDIAFRSYWFAKQIEGVLRQSGYKVKWEVLSDIGSLLIKEATLETIPQIKELITRSFILEEAE